MELPKQENLMDDTDGKNVIGLLKKEISMNCIDSEKSNRIAKKGHPILYSSCGNQYLC